MKDSGKLETGSHGHSFPEARLQPGHGHRVEIRKPAALSGWRKDVQDVTRLSFSEEKVSHKEAWAINDNWNRMPL